MLNWKKCTACTCVGIYLFCCKTLSKKDSEFTENWVNHILEAFGAGKNANG